MLRSDWSSLACLLRYLQIFRSEFDRFLEIAETLVADTNVAVRLAFAVLVAMISNMFMGDGWWTVFQAAGWASVAVAGSRLPLVTSAGLNLGRVCMASIAAAFWFDFLVSFSILDGTFGFYEFVIYLGHGLPFDFLHMVGNLTFVVWLGKWFFNLLEEQPTLEEIEVAVVNGHGIDG